MIRHLAGTCVLISVFCATTATSRVSLAAAGLTAAQESEPVTVTGTLAGPDGARLPGVVVTVIGPGGRPVQVVTGEQGAYRVSGLAAGRYRLRAELQGFGVGELTFDGAPGEVVVRDLRLGLDRHAETVTVVGSASRQTLEPPRVRESGARDVGEALAAMAGVWKVRRGAIASDVVLRGYQGENLTVLIDGARLYGACPNNMDHTAFHVDFAEVERVEVGKGPFDLKNQGGLGGAINIVTRRPMDGLHVNPQVSFGSFGYMNPAVTASFGSKRVAALAGYSYRESDPYRDGSGRSFLAFANYKNGAGDGRTFDVSTAWGRLEANAGTDHAWQVAYTRQRAGDVLYPYLQMDAVYDNADRVNVGYDLRRQVGPVRSLRAQAYFNTVEHWMTDARRTSATGTTPGYSMATRATTDTRGGRVEATVSAGTVGVEIYRRGWDARTSLAMTKYQPQATIPDVVLTSFGVYGEFSRPVGRAWRVDVGGRVDRTRNAADAAVANAALYGAYHQSVSLAAVDSYGSGKARVSYQATPSLTLSGGVGRTVRVPDPQERYFALRRMGTDWVGNPGLRPTANTGVDLNVAYRAGRLFVNGNVHRDALGDAIVVYQQARRAAGGTMNAMARTYRNVDATMSGAEIEAVLPVTDRLFLAGDLSAVRGRQTTAPAAGVRSPWLAEMPPTRGRLALRYERHSARHSGFAEVEAVYSARQGHVNTDLQESATPSYAIANLRIGGSLGRVKAVVGVANLFDRTYVEHLSYQRDPFRSGARVYEPGRNLHANVSVGF